MDNIKNPDVEDWPDVVVATINGVRVEIDYKNQIILMPKGTESKGEAIARYLVDEELAVVDKQTSKRSLGNKGGYFCGIKFPHPVL